MCKPLCSYAPYWIPMRKKNISSIFFLFTRMCSLMRCGLWPCTHFPLYASFESFNKAKLRCSKTNHKKKSNWSSRDWMPFVTLNPSLMYHNWEQLLHSLLFTCSENIYATDSDASWPMPKKFLEKLMLIFFSFWT